MNPSDTEEFSAIAGAFSEKETATENQMVGLLNLARQIWESGSDYNRFTKLLSELEDASISFSEILEQFTKPLPKGEDEARKKLESRLHSLKEKADQHQKNPTFSIVRATNVLRDAWGYSEKLYKLRRLVSVLRSHDLTLWGVTDSYLESIVFKLETWSMAVEDIVFAIEDADWLDAFRNGEDTYKFTEADRQLITDFLIGFSANKLLADDLIERQLPYLQGIKKQLWHTKRALRIFGELKAPVAPSGVVATAMQTYTPTDQERSNPFFMRCLDLLGWQQTCGVDDLANLLGKGDKAQITKIKAVKRWFKGLKPLGIEGKDYRLAEATESHVKDGVAVEVGARIVNYIQGRTRFSTQQAIYQHDMVTKVRQVTQQLRKELGHKPTRKLVASEMGINPDLLKYIYV